MQHFLLESNGAKLVVSLLNIFRTTQAPNQAMKTVVVVALFAAVACLASGQTTNDNTQALVSSQEALEAIQSAVAPTGVMFTGELEQLEDPTTEDSDLASDGDFGKANTEGLVTNDQQEFFGHHRLRHHHRGRWGGWGSYGPYRFKFGCDGYGGWAYPLGYWNTFGAGMYGGGCGFGRAWGGLYYC